MDKEVIQLITAGYLQLNCLRKLDDDAVQYCYYLFQKLFHRLWQCDNINIYRNCRDLLDMIDPEYKDVCENNVYNTEPTSHLLIKYISSDIWNDALNMCFSGLQNLGSHELYLSVCYYSRWYMLCKDHLDFYFISCPEMINKIVRTHFNNNNYNFQKVVSEYITFVLNVWQTKGWEYLQEQLIQRRLPMAQPPLLMIELLAESLLKDLRVSYNKWSGKNDFQNKSFLQLLWTMKAELKAE